MDNIIAMEEIFSSSEEDEDPNIEIINFILFVDEEGRCFCNLCRPTIPRIQTYIEDVIDNYNDIEFQKNFR